MSSTVINDELVALRKELMALGQGFLFSADTTDDGMATPHDAALLDELHALRKTYPGGVVAYIKSAKALLSGKGAAGAEEIVGVTNPPASLMQYAPNLCVSAADQPDEFKKLIELEQIGHTLLKDTVFVLVAGGLGERLGYPSIKVGLPVETATFRTYLELYFAWFAKVGRQGMMGGGGDLFCYPHDDDPHGGTMPTMKPPMNPIIIMTSEDTHSLTERLLESSKYFGYDPSRVFLVKQATVPCVTNRNGDIAIDVTESGAKRLIRKPHGHGDVHQLIYLLGRNEEGTKSPSLLERLLEGSSPEDCGMGGAYKYVTFMQDTNAFSTMTLPVTLAHCEASKMDMNFGCVPRAPGEAIGVFCQQRVKRVAADGTESFYNRCGNVEYNIFLPTLQRVQRVSEEPTLPPNEDGVVYSPYPGSINTLVLRLDRYVASLQESHGAVPEFINPKYKDPVAKTDFKSPARVESLMQDICFNLKGEPGAELEDGLIARVGCSVFHRNTYEPVKNALAEGIDALLTKNIAACTAATGEAQVLYMLRQRLAAASGVNMDSRPELNVLVSSPTNPSQTIPVSLFPIVTYDARFGSSAAEFQARFPTPERVKISARSVLIIKGNVTIHSLDLDGTLIVDASGAGSTYQLGSGGRSCRGTNAVHVDVVDLVVKNAGWKAAVVGDIEADVLPKNVSNRSTVASSGEGGFALLDVDRIRGYVLSREETMVHSFHEAGHFTLTGTESGCYAVFNRPSSL